MQEVVLKLGGAKANGIVQQAKRAFIADASASAKKKSAIKDTITYGSFTLANGGCAALQASGGHTGWTIFAGLCTAFSGLCSGVNLKKLIDAAKAKKETAKTLKDIISKPEFADILKRYLRINGDKRAAIEEFVAKHTKDKNGVLVKLLKDDRKAVEALDKVAFQMPLAARDAHFITKDLDTDVAANMERRLKEQLLLREQGFGTWKK